MSQSELTATDSLANLAEVFQDAEWVNVEKITGMIRCCFGPDNDGFAETNVMLQSAEVDGITGWRWLEEDDSANYDCCESVFLNREDAIASGREHVKAMVAKCEEDGD